MAKSGLGGQGVERVRLPWDLGPGLANRGARVRVLVRSSALEPGCWVQTQGPLLPLLPFPPSLPFPLLSGSGVGVGGEGEEKGEEGEEEKGD